MIRKPNEVPKSLQTIDVKALLRKRGIYTKQRINQELKEQAKPLAKELVKSKKVKEARRHAQFSNEAVLSYWEKQIHIVETAEQHFEDKIRQFIGKIEKDFLSHLESEAEAKKRFTTRISVAKDFFDDNKDNYLVKAQLDFTPLLESVATLAGQNAMKLTGQDQVYLPFGYRDTIKTNVGKFAKSLFDTDRQVLTDILTEGLKDGRSIPEIRASINEVFPEYTKMQAQRITRTEVLRTSNQAAVDAYEQSGVVEGKQWLTAGAVDECAQFEGQIVTLSSGFYGSENEFQDGDPPLHPNCKCVVLPIIAKGD